jgi:hypothetical protein
VPGTSAADTFTADDSEIREAAERAEALADDKDAEIARLKAELAAAKAAPPPEAVIFEAQTPHGAEYRAGSSFSHMTTAELDVLVRKGQIQLREHHVLCSDGWYANPLA